MKRNIFFLILKLCIAWIYISSAYGADQGGIRPGETFLKIPGSINLQEDLWMSREVFLSKLSPKEWWLLGLSSGARRLHSPTRKLAKSPAFAPADSTITGRVTQDGVGVPDVRIWCRNEELGEDLPEAATDGDGYYTLNVASGYDYHIGVEVNDVPSGYTSLPGDYWAVPPGATGNDFEFVSTDSTITGRVTKDGVGVSDVRIHIHCWSERFGNLAGAKTDADGYYTLDVFSGYDYNIIEVEDEDIPYGYVSLLRYYENVPAGATGKDFEFVTTDSTITGQVTKGGVGIPDVDIHCWSELGIPGAKTDADGNYILNILSGYDYYISVDENDIPQGYASLPGYHSEIPAGSTGKDFDFTPTDSTITGRVIKDGIGESNVRIYVDCWSENIGMPGTKTDSNGNYTLNVLSGYNYYIGVSTSEGYACLPGYYYDVPAGAVNKDFEFLPLDNTITGRVTKNGIGEPDVYISIWSNDVRGLRGTSTDSNGDYTLDVLSGYDYHISLYGNDIPQSYVSSPGSYENVPDGADDKDFEFTPANSTITGQVTKDGVGIPDVRIYVSCRSGNLGVPGTRTDSNGNYTLEVMSGYDYYVGVSWEDRPEGYISLPNYYDHVPAGATGKDFEFIPTDSAITGQVTKDGFGEPDVYIQCENDTLGYLPGATTDANGHYTIEVASDYSYEVKMSTYNLPQGYLPKPPYYKDVPHNSTNINFELIPATATISGEIIDGDGGLISDGVRIVADESATGWHVETKTGSPKTNSPYALDVCAGVWMVRLNALVDHDPPYVVPHDKEVEVKEGESITEIDFTCYLATSTITGHVGYEDGTDATGISIHARSRSDTYPEEVKTHTNTDGEGNYTLHVSDSEWEFNVSPDHIPDDYVVFPAYYRNILEGSSGKDFTFVPANSTIKGRVTKDGVGVPKFTIHSNSAGDTYAARTRTDEGGYYVLDVKDGINWNIWAAWPIPPGYVRSPGSYNDIPADSTNIDFEIVPGKQIIGTVRDNLGVPVSNVWVNAGSWWGKTDESGNYSIIVPEGTWTVQTSKASYTTEPQFTNPVTISGSDATDINFILTSHLIADISVSHDFGEVNIGDTSPVHTFIISNTGNADLEIHTITLTGEDSSEFSIQDDNCQGQTLFPSETCLIDVVFSPLSVGPKSANLSISSNDPDTPTSNLLLSGRGVIFPAIGLDPTTLNFYAQVGGASPHPKTFKITNISSGNLNWMASKEATWLSLSDTCGTNDATVNVSVDINSLSSGEQTASIIVSDPAASNSPQKVTVRFTIIASDESLPIIDLTRTSLVFHATVNGEAPTPQTFKITNIGGASLNWTASAPDTAPWLSFLPASGTDGGEVTASIDINGLPVGIYSAPMTIDDPAAINSPQRVEVTVVITDGSLPIIGLSRRSLDFYARAEMTDPPSQTVTITNIGGDTLDWIASANADWLSLSFDDAVLIVSIDISGLPVGIYPGSITISDSRAINSPQEIGVTLHIDERPEVSIFNYPNPVRAKDRFTTFKFYCESPEAATIDIYDLGYELVETLTGYDQGPAFDGYCKKEWDITHNILRGVYLYVFKCNGGKTIVKKVMVVK